MIDMTLVFPIDLKEEKVLLGLKKRGHRKGLYTGFGGKIEPDEQIIDCAARELYEESMLVVEKSDLRYSGMIEFVFPDSLTTDGKIHFFLTFNWKGIPVETDEMKPEWFSFPDAIMTVDKSDRTWMPILFSDLYFEGKILYDYNNEMLKGGIKWENLNKKE